MIEEKIMIDQLDEASREAWEERAAIAEYDGGLSRKDAEALAWNSVKFNRGERQ